MGVLNDLSPVDNMGIQLLAADTTRVYAGCLHEGQHPRVAAAWRAVGSFKHQTTVKTLTNDSFVVRASVQTDSPSGIIAG